MRVSILAGASVSDCIGLVLYKCNMETQHPLLQDDVSSYSLRIAEEDGEVDDDFPPLDPNENIAKFGFPTLGLIRKNVHSTKKIVVVTV
jgi:hypothetical protein